MSDQGSSVRIDKWLWAARFFKTRSLARKAIEGGKVHMEGQRVKPSKDVVVGIFLKIRQGFDEREVLVTGISEHRRGAPEAAQLYQETAASIERRQRESESRKLAKATMGTPAGRPNKKQRRQIHRFKHSGDLE